MIFLIYLAAFLIFLFFRRYCLEGKHLFTNKNDDGPSYLASSGYTETDRRYYGLPQKKGPYFIVKRERWYHRKLIKLGLVQELVTGDKDFDNHFFILTDTPDNLKSIFTNPELRSYITKLFEHPINTLYSVKNRIWFRVDKIRGLSKPTGKTVLNEELQCLHKIRVKTHNLNEKPVPERTSSRRNIAFIIISIHAALFCLAMFGMATVYIESSDTIDASNLGAHAFMLGVLLCVFWLPVILLIFRNSSWFGWVMIDFAVIGIVGIMGTTTLIMREINVQFDKTPPIIKTAIVAKKGCQLICSMPSIRTRHTSVHTIDESDWDNLDTVLQDMKKRDITCRNNAYFSFYAYISPVIKTNNDEIIKGLNRTDFYRITTGDLARVPVHPGFLNYSWIRNEEIKIRLLPPTYKH